MAIVTKSVPSRIKQSSVTYVPHGFNASCEKLKDEQYNILASSNIIYYCSLNSCASRIKTILAEWIQTSSNLAKSLNESQAKFLLQCENLHKNLTNLSSKLDNLQSSETELQNCI